MDKDKLKNGIQRILQVYSRTNEGYRAALKQLDSLLADIPDEVVIAEGETRYEVDAYFDRYYIGEKQITDDFLHNNLIRRHIGKNIRLKLEVLE